MCSVPTRIHRALFLGLALCCATAAYAQPAAPADAARAAERIQREEQERQRQQFLQDQQRRAPPASIDVPLPPISVPGAGTGCVNVREIAIDGAPHLPAAERESIDTGYTGRCLYVADIEKILGEITRSYIERGYATTRVYIQQQDASSGRLELRVVEGVLEKIVLRGDAARTVSQGNVFPGLENQPLNLRSLEQGLNQINRLGSNNATMEIAPGATPGGSVVSIDNAAGRPFSVSLSADNQGSTATGREQIGASFGLDNPLGFNDFISLTHRQTVPAQVAPRRALADSLSYTLPFGFSTVSVGWSRSSYTSTFSVPSGLQLRTSGNSVLGFVRVDRLVYQDRSSRATVSATITGKNAKNYLAQDLLTVSSRKLAVADLDANYSTVVMGGVLGLDLGWSQGLRALGALRDIDGLPDTAPRAQFRKLRYGANFGMPFRLLGQDAHFSSQLTGQHAQDPLYGSEQISIGGIYAVRGFFNSNLAGDDGFVLRNELALQFPVTLPGDTVGTLRPYIGFDHGRASSKEPGNPDGALTGAAVGIGLNAGRFGLDFFYAKGLSRPSSVPREAGRLFVTLRIRI